MKVEIKYQSQFEEDIVEGLSKPVKKLSSKYFYDEKGDILFQKIMQLEEYYLPESELEILKNKTDEMLEGFSFQKFNVVELGAGDGSKTVHFLKRLNELGKDFIYTPLDISADVLDTNAQLVNKELPNLEIVPIAGDYFQTLSKVDNELPRVILFLGSNIGNYENEAAVDFLQKVKNSMRKGDRLLVGIDLKKNPKTILSAYNDSKGVTKAFNLNLLHRINRELDADFDVNNFDHYPSYNPLTGITYSFIVSLKKQKVRIGSHEVFFKNGEIIHTEVSQKYCLNHIELLKEESGFYSVQHFLDEKEYFSISVFEI